MLNNTVENKPKMNWVWFIVKFVFILWIGFIITMTVIGFELPIVNGLFGEIPSVLTAFAVLVVAIWYYVVLIKRHLKRFK